MDSINIHHLQEKCKSKKELYRFLSQDCKAYLPKIGSANIYFFKQILQGQKEYLNREQVKVSLVPHIEGLTVQDFLNFARNQTQLLKYLPDEQDWVHLDRQWICDVIYTIDTDAFQRKIEQAINQRQQKIIQQQNLTINMRPEFAQALKECRQFSTEKGRSVFLLKNSSKRKRRIDEIEEVKSEEELLKQDKQEYLREHKRLKISNEEMQTQLQQLQDQQNVLQQLVNVGIINERGDIMLQQQFDI